MRSSGKDSPEPKWKSRIVKSPSRAGISAANAEVRRASAAARPNSDRSWRICNLLPDHEHLAGQGHAGSRQANEVAARGPKLRARRHIVEAGFLDLAVDGRLDHATAQVVDREGHPGG